MIDHSDSFIQYLADYRDNGQKRQTLTIRKSLTMDTAQLLAEPSVVRLAKTVVDSYFQLVGEHLIDSTSSASDRDLAAMLYELPAVVLSHDGAADPTFTFANRAAQQLFEYSWDEFLTLRSRQSAEPDQRSSRSEMLARAARDGYISDYQGVRISASGKRFEIKNAIIWNVTDAQRNAVGQAAVFDQWQLLPK